MKVLVFGKTGQVAQELARRMPNDVDARFVSRRDADLRNPEACARLIDDTDIDAVINAAAWTDVDAAEADEDTATIVNAAAPAAMARACAAADIPFLHISTDYVFDGKGDAPFRPDDPTCPINAYGRSKRAGEEAIRASGARHVILRTSWVVSAHGTNFVKSMLRLGALHPTLRVVADQHGGPTAAASIAKALYVITRKILDGHHGGTYHFAGAPDVSWADLARATMLRANLECQIADIPASAYAKKTNRPLNSKLCCSTLNNDFSILRPDWREDLDTILTDLGA